MEVSHFRQVPSTRYVQYECNPETEDYHMIKILRYGIFNAKYLFTATGKHRIASGLLVFFVLLGLWLAYEGPWYVGLLCVLFVFMTLDQMYLHMPEREKKS